MSDVTTRLAAALSDRYTLERGLGAGGMATVYLAHDLKHDRKVAIKVLRPELAAVLGAERFVQEIKTTANLQHPNILPLFDSGEADTFLYYVMPYVEGETLRDKLNRETQLGVEEAVKLTTEVADALDYAHRQNVIHRDIKPENILLHDGRPLVADFGIALAVSAAAGGRMTETGLSLGTPHYMSPEQATADKHVTHRSDIYSLGAVLYEMLTGEPPHTGSSAQAIILKIVTDQARPVTELRKAVPAHVAAAVAQALEKLPADRFESAAQFAEALANPAFAAARGAHGVGRAAVAVSRSRWRGGMAAMAIIGVAVGALGAWLLGPRSAARPSDVARFAFAAPVAWGVISGPVLDVSPANGDIVFIGVGAEGRPQVFRRPLGAMEAVPIAGATGNEIQFPAISPDGSQIAFFADLELRTVSMEGGVPRVLARMPAGSKGLSWGPGEILIYAPSVGRGLWVIPEGGADPRPLTTLDSARPEEDHRWPQVLPDGETVVFTIWKGRPESARIALTSLKTGRVRELTDGTYARYADGQLVFATAEGSLRRFALDPRRAELEGLAVTTTQVAVVRSDGSAHFALSRSGTLAIISESRALVPVFIDPVGTAVPLPLSPGLYAAPRISPDGRLVAWHHDGYLWTYDLELGTHSRLAERGFYPVWSKDSRRLYFSRNVGLDVQVLTIPADRSDDARPLLAARGHFRTQDITADGRSLLLRGNQAEDSTSGIVGQYDLWVFPLDGDGTVTRLTESDFLERSATLSPDGGWVAYSSDESGRDEIYVRAFSGPGGRVQVSTDGGTEPAWSPNGAELVFRRGNVFNAVRVQTSPTFRVLARPREIFEGQYYHYPWQRQYDLHPDGRRVLALQLQDPTVPITVVANWLPGERLRESR